MRELGRGLGFTEGPVIAPDGTVFVASVSHGRIYRVDGGSASVFAEVGGGPNGLALGADGTIYVAQNGGRLSPDGPSFGPDRAGGVQAVDPDGGVRWVTRDPISPNDLCFGPDGLLYVTDPTRSVLLDDARLWRVDPRTGAAELLCSVPWFANGIAFGPDDGLYVASTRDSRIVRFDLAGGRLRAERTVVRMAPWLPDGFAFDADGRLIVATIPAEPEGRGTVRVFSASGDLEDVIASGDARYVTNVALGPDRRLVVTESDRERVAAVDDRPAAGLPLHPFR